MRMVVEWRKKTTKPIWQADSSVTLVVTRSNQCDISASLLFPEPRRRYLLLLLWPCIHHKYAMSLPVGYECIVCDKEEEDIEGGNLLRCSNCKNQFYCVRYSETPWTSVLQAQWPILHSSLLNAKKKTGTAIKLTAPFVHPERSQIQIFQ